MLDDGDAWRPVSVDVQQCPQALVRAGKLRLGKTGRCAEQRADLGVRAALDVVQPDDGPRFVAELCQRALEVDGIGAVRASPHPAGASASQSSVQILRRSSAVACAASGWPRCHGERRCIRQRDTAMLRTQPANEPRPSNWCSRVITSTKTSWATSSAADRGVTMRRASVRTGTSNAR